MVRATGERPLPLAGAGRCADRVRVPGQDAAGVPGRARVRAGLPVGRRRRGCGSASGSCCCPGWASSSAPAGGSWSPSWCPAADRPYFGGSTNNNILQLAIGYNGLGRMDGNETGSIGGGGGWRGGGSAFGGSTGITRLFARSSAADQLAAPGRADRAGRHAVGVPAGDPDRPDPGRGPALGRLADGHRLVFSYMSGTVHPYYMVALAPAIAALVGIGGRWPGGSDAGLAGAGGGFGRRGGDGGVGVRAARPDAGLVPVAAVGHRRRGGAGRAGHPGRTAAGRLGARPVGAGAGTGRLGLAGVPVVLALVAGLAGRRPTPSRPWPPPTPGRSRVPAGLGRRDGSARRAVRARRGRWA